MHIYLKAIGFSDFEDNKAVRKKLNRIINSAVKNNMVKKCSTSSLCEIKEEIAPDMGIIIRGEMDNNKFVMEYYFPYFNGGIISSNEPITVERYAEKESYAGICEDLKVGVSLIFNLNNALDCLEMAGDKKKKYKTALRLSALSNSGKIILPVRKTKLQVLTKRASSRKRINLISAARNGDEDAIEYLTVEDLDTYSKLTRRIGYEDVFTIVDTAFMPYGFECDRYSVVGEIKELKTVVNKITKEEIYVMIIESNELLYSVAINKNNLYGEPMVGRRFKGEIWLQGTVDFIS